MRDSLQTRPTAQLNILFPFPLAAAGLQDTLARGSAQRLSREQYASTRQAAADLEAREDTAFDGPEHLELVQRVVAALAGHPAAGAAMARAAGVDPAEAGAIGYMTIDEIDPRVGPPEGVPIFNPYLGILAVPEPEEGGAEAVSTTVQGVDASLQVQPAVLVRAISQLDPFAPPGMMLPTAASPLGLPAAGGNGAALGSAEGEGLAAYAETEELWPEAALEAEIAAETIPWGIARVHAPQAWARGFIGRGVRVAVVDTGIAPHIDLPAPVAGVSFVPGVASWHDDNGHGTHVSGTIAARRNGRGVIGVAPGCDLIAVKVLNAAGSGSDTAVANGIVWAANHGAQLINLSLGSDAASEVIHRALVYARSRRVAVCAAAGNNSSPTVCRPVIYPARDPLCIAVAATTPTNGKATFSCCGPELDLAAPGVEVLSTWPGNAYRTLNGTSMATPHATGTAALVLQRAPGLEPSRLERHLERSAVPLGLPSQFGRGLVQCDRAVTMPILLSVPDAEAGPPTAANEDDRALAAANGGHHGRAPRTRHGT